MLVSSPFQIDGIRGQTENHDCGLSFDLLILPRTLLDIPIRFRALRDQVIACSFWNQIEGRARYASYDMRPR